MMVYIPFFLFFLNRPKPNVRGVKTAWGKRWEDRHFSTGYIAHGELMIRNPKLKEFYEKICQC